MAVMARGPGGVARELLPLTSDGMTGAPQAYGTAGPSPDASEFEIVSITAATGADQPGAQQSEFDHVTTPIVPRPRSARLRLGSRAVNSNSSGDDRPLITVMLGLTFDTAVSHVLFLPRGNDCDC